MNLEQFSDVNRHKLGSGRRYSLFLSEAHEEIRLEFTTDCVKKFIDMWNTGYTKEEICKALHIKPVELALIVIDLDYAGIIQPRDGVFIDEATQQTELEL